MAEVADMMEIVEDSPSPRSDIEICEVVKIASRKESPDGNEHLYEVHWKDGDVTFEPVANLSGAADALRIYLEANHPDDALLKMLSSLAESDQEENGADVANGVDSNLNFLARWHQKTTRGSTQYWLRKGEDTATVPSLLKRGIMEEAESSPMDTTPLAPATVPETPGTPEVAAVLFSDGEGTPGNTPGSTLRTRKRIRIIEETVKMFPHEELYDLEQHQNRTLALWQEMLSGVLLVGCCICLFFYLYVTMYRSPPVNSAS